MTTPRQEGMTRSEFRLLLLKGTADEAVEVYATQHETITRLENLTTMQDVGIRGLHEQIKDKNEQIEQLQARLTASEAREKQQADVLAYLLDCGPEIVQAVQEAKSDVSEDYGEEQREEREALRAQVKSLQQAKRWTLERPTVEGVYWRRFEGKGYPAHIVDIVQGGRGLAFKYAGRWEYLSDIKGNKWQFQGPLTPGDE